MQTEYIIVKLTEIHDYDAHYGSIVDGMTDWQVTDDINEIYKKVNLINKWRFQVSKGEWDALAVITKVDETSFDDLYTKALEKENKLEQKRKKDKERRDAAKLKREQKTIAQKKAKLEKELEKLNQMEESQ